MRPCCIGPLVLGLLLPTIATADNSKEEAIKMDRQQIKGIWRIVALEINGNKANADDARKLTVINGSDGTWSLLSEGKEICQGTSSFDPTKKPKTIDFKITEGGGKGNEHLGIYELGEKTRRLCFAPPANARPTEFATALGSGHILVNFEREK